MLFHGYLRAFVTSCELLCIRYFSTACFARLTPAERLVQKLLNLFMVISFFVSHPLILRASRLTIGSCVNLRILRYETRGKFGEHERDVRVAQGAGESNFSLLTLFMVVSFLCFINSPTRITAFFEADHFKMYELVLKIPNLKYRRTSHVGHSRDTSIQGPEKMST